MTNFLATPFHGDRDDEDPSDFLTWFLQYLGSADNKTKAWNFIYYLQVDSLADEWFEGLGEEKEDKGSWVVIEGLFCEKWLKYEETITRKKFTSEESPRKATSDPHHFPQTLQQSLKLPQISKIGKTTENGSNESQVHTHSPKIALKQVLLP